MAKSVKIPIKQLNLQVNFTPVGNLIPYKLPFYKYFKLLNNTADFQQSGKKLFENYSNGTLTYIKDFIPITNSYGFVNIINNDSYYEFATLYVNGKLREVIEAIKTYVRVELPQEVQAIVNTVDNSVKEQKIIELTKKLSSQSFYQGIIDSIITGSQTLKEQVLLYVLNPNEILKMQYNYMLFKDEQESGSAELMKEGVDIAFNESYDIFNRGARKYRCYDAINQKARSVIASNKQLLEQVKVVNNTATDVISYINQNLYALYDIFKVSPNQSSANLRQQGYNLGLALNPLTKDRYLGGNKNTKTKGMNLTTILLLAIPIVAIILLKKKGK